MMKIHTLSVVGVGLLGGSIALAARLRHVAQRIVGVDRNPAVRERALRNGLLDEAPPDLAGAAGGDVVVFCTPVDCIAEQVLALAPLCRPGVLLTDVGSTKAHIVAALEGRLPAGVHFVGSHPLAGSEKHGAEHARADLLDGRLVVVTPAASTDGGALARAGEFWRALGGRVESMDPGEHDRALALTSHLPHLVASALAGVLPAEWQHLTATGFRDTTRLAAGNPGLWTAILCANQAAVLEALDRLGGQLERFRQALAGGERERLEGLLRQGKQVRDGLAGR
jgi:prephenate dehydrogenase